LSQWPSLEERFWDNVFKTDTCWLWLGYVNKSGYGKIFGENTYWLAHRLSWKIHYGEDPGSLLVCHTCDVPPCIRPDHLFLGTHTDNGRDMAQKGRQKWQAYPELIPVGEQASRSKLIEEQVRLIRLSTPFFTTAELAERYLVCKATIYNVVTRRNWRHVS